MTSATTPNPREQYSAHIPALHLLCNLGWHFVGTAEALALRGGSTREVLLVPRLVEVLQTRRYEYKGQWYPLSPGGIDQIVRDRAAASGQSPEAILEGMRKTVPAGRFASPAEVGGVIAFLCSPWSDYVTGQVLNVSGGIAFGMGA